MLAPVPPVWNTKKARPNQLMRRHYSGRGGGGEVNPSFKIIPGPFLRGDVAEPCCFGPASRKARRKRGCLTTFRRVAGVRRRAASYWIMAIIEIGIAIAIEIEKTEPSNPTG
jgi:hypothetical protein